jgi:hypothetical protein
VLSWGGPMFASFAIAGPLITHFTMGKPLTLGLYIATALTSAILMLPVGALFGWGMWLVAKWRCKRQA